MTDEPKKKLSVLLVDDDSFLLELYALKFNKDIYDVQTLTNAELAVDKIAEGYNPDIIVLDIIMPKMDGLDFLKARKEKNLVPNTVIVVLSNQGAPTDIKAATDLGAQGYIIKATTIPSEVVIEVQKTYDRIKGVTA